MHSRILAAAAAVVAVGALSVPTVAHADTTSPPSATSTVVEEHGILLPADRVFTPLFLVKPEGGGTWSYGTNGPNNTVFSNFYHATRKHGSTAENGAGNAARSADTAAGRTSKASIRKTYAGNHAYYRFVK